MTDYVIMPSADYVATCEAIRAQTGTTGKITSGAVAEMIRSIQVAGTAGIPDDIVAEANRVASSILSKKESNSITFIVMTDMHEMGDSDHSDASIIKRYRKANLNAGQGARVIAEKIKPDFFANLGDLAWGSSSTTLHDWAQSVRAARGYTAGMEPLTECFFTPGNHDSGYPNGDYDENLVVGLIGNYRYVDFAAKKVRVICLNTADNTDGTNGCERISGEQLQWFANALDLSSKSDAAKWGILILSHHPLDYGSIKPAANCLAAYVNGTNYSTTHDGMSISKDFTGKNLATVIANFHGHLHSLFVTDISGTAVKRIAIPNACFGRNNEYGTEATTYNKVDNGTGKNTAFNVVSIDLPKKIIYADCFGAGYDRILSYGTADITTYSVTNNLTNASNSNGSATVLSGSSYSAIITTDEGYDIDAVTVKMGGVDITATAYSNGRITIAEVTGDIVITVTTVSNVVYDVTNLVPTSQQKGSTAVYNGIGYKNGAYVSDNGTDGTDANCVAVGFIPYNKEVIYIRGATLNTANSHVRIRTYHADKSDGLFADGSNITNYFTVETLDTNYYKLAPKDALNISKFYRISLVGTGENLIITHNEPIEVGGSDPGTVYTNLVLKSTDANGNLYNGTGYQEGYRLNSSGTTTEEKNAVVSGFIPYNGEVIRVWGTASQNVDNSGNYIGMYDAAFNKTHVVSMGTLKKTGGTWLSKDNKYMLTIDPEACTNETVKNYFLSAKYIRVSMVNCAGTDLVVTLDEPIE